MELLIKDIQYGIRGLLKRPGFAAVIISTLALAIGGNTAIFSVVNAVLLRPLPFEESGQLVTVWERNPKQGYEQNPPAAGNYLDWQQQNTVFQQLAIYAPSKRFNVSLDEEPARISGAAVSASLFEVLRVAPIQGRVFSSEEEQPGQNQVVVISYNFAQKHFPSDPNPIGKPIVLDGMNYTIIGVMPPGFQFPGGSGTVLRNFTAESADLWVPLTLDAETVRQRSSHSLNVIGRLKLGVTVAQANAEMDTIQQRLQQEYPEFYVGSSTKLVALTEQVIGTTRRPVLILWGAVAFILLIGCANVANLLLARTTARAKEISVRAALGASRRRLICQLLTESLLLSFAGAILGTVLAAWAVHLLATIVPEGFPRREAILIDGWVLSFTLLVSTVSGLIFGIAPAVQSTRTDLSSALKSGGRSQTEAGGTHRLRSLLVVGEMALAFVLVIGASLMLQSFLRLQHVDPGFRPDHVLTMELSLPAVRYPQKQRAPFFQQLLDRSKALPGVQSAAAAKHLPLSGENMNFAFDVEGRPFPSGKSPGADCRFVTSDYFNALGISLIKGRVFNDRDDPRARHVLLINESMARRFFPDEDPIGKRLVLGINGFGGQIVGVVGNVKHVGLDVETSDEVYVPYAQAPYWTEMTLVLRTTGAPLSIAGAVRKEVQTLDKQVPIGRVRTMETITLESIAQARFRSLLLGLFGVTALLLAAVGVYGVMSYTVTQRTHEIGIRMALGAQLTDVRSLVLRNGMVMALVGIVLGMSGALALTRLMKSMLFEVSATDLATFATVSGSLVVVALLACYIPVRRATKIDPLTALRYE